MGHKLCRTVGPQKTYLARFFYVFPVSQNLSAFRAFSAPEASIFAVEINVFRVAVDLGLVNLCGVAGHGFHGFG